MENAQTQCPGKVVPGVVFYGKIENNTKSAILRHFITNLSPFNVYSVKLLITSIYFFISLKKLFVQYEMGGLDLVAKITHAFLDYVRRTEDVKPVLSHGESWNASAYGVFKAESRK